MGQRYAGRVSWFERVRKASADQRVTCRKALCPRYFRGTDGEAYRATHRVATELSTTPRIAVGVVLVLVTL